MTIFKNVTKRVFALFMAFIMVCPLIPWWVIQVHAVDPVTVLDGKLEISGDDNTQSLSVDNGTVTAQSKLKIEVDSCGNVKEYSGLSTVITIKNVTDSTAIISFSYTSVIYVKSITAEDGKDGKVTVALDPGETTTLTIEGNGSSAEAYGKATITDFTYTASSTVTLTYGEAVNGSYTVNGVDPSTLAEKTVEIETTTLLTLVATPAEGYVFAGWKDLSTGKYISLEQSSSSYINSDITISPIFVSDAEYNFVVYSTDLTKSAKFVTFDDAIAAASSTAGSIVFPVKDVVLSKNYTIPLGVTLLIP